MADVELNYTVHPAKSVGKGRLRLNFSVVAEKSGEGDVPRGVIVNAPDFTLRDNDGEPVDRSNELVCQLFCDYDGENYEQGVVRGTGVARWVFESIPLGRELNFSLDYVHPDYTM